MDLCLVVRTRWPGRVSPLEPKHDWLGDHAVWRDDGLLHNTLHGWATVNGSQTSRGGLEWLGCGGIDTRI
jgi:hypothetical protein